MTVTVLVFFFLLFSLSFCCSHPWLLNMFVFLLFFNQGIAAQDQQLHLPPPLGELLPQLKLKAVGPALVFLIFFLFPMTATVWFFSTFFLFPSAAVTPGY